MPRVWFVTGCATGFGALIAQAIVKRGDQLVATDKDGDSMSHLADADNVLKLSLDVTQEDQIKAAVAQAIEKFGRIDVLVNNAGLGYGGPYEEMDLARNRLLFEVNILGMMAVTHAALPHMRAQGGGHIINISSNSGILGQPFSTSYCATKHAVEGFSEALSFEVMFFGIKVSVIEPCGFFNTAMPNEAVAQAERMASESSPYYPITSKMIEVAKEGLKHANSPEMVSEAVMAVADMDEPPLRYPVGRQEETQLLAMRRQMPDEEFIRMMRSNLS